MGWHKVKGSDSEVETVDGPSVSHGSRASLKLENIDDDQRDVILLAYRDRSPPLEFGEQTTGQLGGGLQSILAYDILQLSVAKRLARSVLSLGYPVGVKQEAIGGFKRYAAYRVVGVRFDSEQQPVAFDTLHFAALIPPAQ